MIIVGVTGPAGAGKDVASSYIAEKLGVDHVSGGDVLRTILKRLDVVPSKDAVSDLGLFLRKHSDSVITRVIKQAFTSNGVVISGFRSMTEANDIKSNGGIICYIDATPELRHQRITTRKRGGDKISSKDLESLDQKEHSTEIQYGENLNKVKRNADIVIENNSSIDDFYTKLDVACEKMSQANT